MEGGRGLKAADEFEVDQAGGEAFGDGVSGVGEVFDEEVGDGIEAVDDVEDLEGGPDIIEIAEGAVAAAVAFFAVEQQGAKAHIDADIRVDEKGIAVFYAAWNIVRKITTVNGIDINLKVLIGGKVILEEHAKGEQAVARASHPSLVHECTVNRFVY